MKERFQLHATSYAFFFSALTVLVACGATSRESTDKGLAEQRESHAVIQEVQDLEVPRTGESDLETLAKVDADPTGEVTEVITTMWNLFRSGVDNQANRTSNRCQDLPNYQRNLVAEMKNLRATLGMEFGDVSEIAMQVLSVRQSGPNEVEAVTRLVYHEEPLSDPGTQRLILEDGKWKPDNCDERELKISFECGDAFGDEHRHDCISFWHEIVAPSRCDLENPNFVQDFAGAVYGPNPLTSDQQWLEFSKSCVRESRNSVNAASRQTGGGNVSE